MDQLPRLGKRWLIPLLLFTCNCVVSVGEVSSSSGYLEWATLFYCGTPSAFHIIILHCLNATLCSILSDLICLCGVTTIVLPLFNCLMFYIYSLKRSLTSVKKVPGSA